MGVRTFLLKVPARVAKKLCDNPERRKIKKKDIHERDLAHFRDTEKAYIHAVRMFPRDFTPVECVSRGRLLAPDEIHQQVWKNVQRLL